ncbi:MAG: peptidoglycan-binding domain-containing protein [Pseudomonadota bacterium]|nr:peptidoglycan-binding domain-containing protein [Pseudomonadota bacterium]
MTLHLRFDPSRLIAWLLCSTLLTACQSIEPPRPEPDPSQPPPAPITPPSHTLPRQGEIVTAPLPGRPESTVPATTRLTLRHAQTLLSGMGYDPGPTDGLAGRRTAAALRAFQQDHGLPTSGQLDDATRRALTRLAH